MRIISGKYRGKKLFSPESDKVRPTADRTREALFNILNSSLEKDWGEYRLLDVFAGTGAFGLEALSRGVAEIALLDKDTRSLEKNIALFPQEKEKIKVHRMNALSLPPALHTYNVVFMDAPYHQGLTTPALEQLALNGWLTPGALCLVEVEKKEQLQLPACYTLQNERIYGLAKVLFLTYNPC